MDTMDIGRELVRVCLVLYQPERQVFKAKDNQRDNYTTLKRCKQLIIKALFSFISSPDRNRTCI